MATRHARIRSLYYGEVDKTQRMEVDERDEHDDESARYQDAGMPESDSEEEPQPLTRVRYGLGKELLLFPDTFVVVHKEERDELRLNLDNVRRLILVPGEYTPSKLVLMFDLDDGNTIIAAEGMTNVRDFRKLLARLREIRPEIELDPPNMDEQLMQALDIRKRSLIGCYGFVFGTCLLIWIVYLIVAFIGARGVH
ncbi:MAG: hypothetical protein ACXVCO_00975 [Ktedonobacterales bacterium]